MFDNSDRLRTATESNTHDKAEGWGVPGVGSGRSVVEGQCGHGSAVDANRARRALPLPKNKRAA